jgi:hypothetical protein
MFSIILILLIIFAAGLNNLFFTWIVKCDDGVFKYLLKTTFCLILSVTSILAGTAIISNILAILLRLFGYR